MNKLTRQILVFIWLKLFEIFRFILVGCWYVSFWGSVVTLLFFISYGIGFSITKMFGMVMDDTIDTIVFYCAVGCFFIFLLAILWANFPSKKFKKWIEKNWKEAGRIVEGKK